MGTVGVSGDITERKLANIELQKTKENLSHEAKELKRSNEELKKSREVLGKTDNEALAYEQYMMYALMNNVDDKIYFKDTEGRFIRVNQATSLAHGIVDPKEMEGMSDFDFFTKEYAQAALEYEKEVMRTGQSIEKEEKEKWSDGHEIWVSTKKQPLRDFEGNVIGTFGITRDINQSKLAEEALQRAKEDISRHAKALYDSNIELENSKNALERSNRELEQFAYVASHDLQEPLRMVSSYVSLLAKRYKDKLDSTAEEFIEYAVDGAQRMQRLINDLLSYSRVATRGKPFVPTNCEEVFKHVEMNLKIAIEENQAVVKHDPLPTVNADTVQLERLFQNLIGNAIKYHGEKSPEVVVSAEKNGQFWTFSIKDNGIGIGPDDRECVFGIFQRLHSREAYSGTGIGLAVCKKIVERHKGEIWVESELGKGSIFKFTMPMMS